MDKYIVRADMTVKEAIEHMTVNLIKAVIIVDSDQKVLGLFSNGDMRLFFLKGGGLNSIITDAMNRHPVLYRSQKEVEEERKSKIRVIYPIVDENNILVDVIDGDNVQYEPLRNESLKEIPLVIMAGGKGTRLYPYTKILPKPLIPIGDITITERIINRFRTYGCNEVIMILNYKANMIKAYMNEIQRDYSLGFVEEQEYLGTGGGLSLLKGKVDTTFYLSNCDTLLEADLECAYLTHKKNQNKITFICAMKDFIVPFGVIEADDKGAIMAMKEKPDYSFLVNTGVYIIEPEVLDYLDPGEAIGLPDLALKLIQKGERVGVFPIPEKAWMDMGQFTEMENMVRSLGIN